MSLLRWDVLSFSKMMLGDALVDNLLLSPNIRRKSVIGFVLEILYEYTLKNPSLVYVPGIFPHDKTYASTAAFKYATLYVGVEGAWL